MFLASSGAKSGNSAGQKKKREGRENAGQIKEMLHSNAPCFHPRSPASVLLLYHHIIGSRVEVVVCIYLHYPAHHTPHTHTRTHAQPQLYAPFLPYHSHHNLHDHQSGLFIFLGEIIIIIIMLGQALAVVAAAIFVPLLWNLGHCWRAIVNDANIISLDPALQSKLEVLYAYPGEFKPSNRLAS